MKFIYALLILMIISGPLTASENHSQRLLGQVGFDELRVENIVIGVESQDLIFDLRVTYDFDSVVEGDNLESIVDYLQLAEIVSSMASEDGYDFIQDLGINILKEVFHLFPEVEKGSIRIETLSQSKSGRFVDISLSRDDPVGGEIMGMIGMDQLHTKAIIGYHPMEWEIEQDLFADVRMMLDLQDFAERGINDSEISKLFGEVAKEGKYQMIETLAVDFLKKLYKHYPHIHDATVLIRKPGALLGYPFENGAVTEVRLSNPGYNGASLYEDL